MKGEHMGQKKVVLSLVVLALVAVPVYFTGFADFKGAADGKISWEPDWFIPRPDGWEPDPFKPTSRDYQVAMDLIAESLSDSELGTEVIFENGYGTVLSPDGKKSLSTAGYFNEDALAVLKSISQKSPLTLRSTKNGIEVSVRHTVSYSQVGSALASLNTDPVPSPKNEMDTINTDPVPGPKNSLAGINTEPVTYPQLAAINTDPVPVTAGGLDAIDTEPIPNPKRTLAGIDTEPIAAPKDRFSSIIGKDSSK